MTRKPITIRITEDNIRELLKAGDIIADAEELGVVVSARPTIHDNGTAFVYFMGGDCYKEMFGIPQTITVLRDSEGFPFEWTGRPIGTHVMVEISKVGGGTVGRRYSGRWSYRITVKGKVVAEGEDMNTPRVYTHEEAARVAWGFQDTAYAADYLSEG